MLALFVEIPTMYSVYERSAVFPQIPNILQITVRYSASHISAGHAYTGALAAALLITKCYQPET